MTYKVNDLVYFDDGYQKGVGKVIVVDDGYDDLTYSVHSTQIVDGRDGTAFAEKQDNNNNWWFSEDDLKPFTKKVGQRYKVISDDFTVFGIGDIVILAELSDDKISDYESECGEYRSYMYDIDHDKCEVEFYAEAPSAKENGMFTKEDLKAGYLVKNRKGHMAHVVDSTEEGLCLNSEYGWDKLSNYSNDLYNTKDKLYDIVEVYGYTRHGLCAHKFEVGNRELLWKREEVKEMTIEDIQKALGHKIKVLD